MKKFQPLFNYLKRELGAIAFKSQLLDIVDLSFEDLMNQLPKGSIYIKTEVGYLFKYKELVIVSNKEEKAAAFIYRILQEINNSPTTKNTPNPS